MFLDLYLPSHDDHLPKLSYLKLSDHQDGRDN